MSRPEVVLVNVADWSCPHDLPEDDPDTGIVTRIVNAPRPLRGLATWVGPCRHGTVYAAAPQSPWGPDPYESFGWRADDAWPVEFITNDEIRARVLAEFAEHGYASEHEAGVTIAEQAASMRLPWHEPDNPETTGVRRTS